MKKWQPPILSGVLYSLPARELGPALALLGYCYDVVQADGTLTINLHVAAADMEMDYPTVKRWWQKLRQSPFITDVDERGRAGIRARLRDEYIDWRIIAQRETGSKVIPNKEEANTETGSDLIPNTRNEQETGQKRDKNGITFSRPYIGTHDTQESLPFLSETEAPPVASPPAKQKPTKNRTPKEPNDHQRLMAAYQAILGYPIPNGAQEGTAAAWLLNHGYTVEQIIDCYKHEKKRDYWQDKHLSLQSLKKPIGPWIQAQQQAQARASPSIGPPVLPYAPNARDAKGIAERLQAMNSNGLKNHDDTA